MHGMRKSLLQMLFSGSYMLRWNDKLRPVDLTEVDKQGHKMILAFMLWHENSRHMPLQEKYALAQEIIEGGLFDYFYRLVITDIKPPIFYRIKENTEHYRKLTAHVLHSLEPTLRPLNASFWQRLCAYHEAEHKDLASRILTAAHLYASRWECHIIKDLNPFDDEMPEIVQSFESRLHVFRDELKGMAEVLDPRSALGRLANLSGQLRFQIRWTQVPRIPATSVLGHMFLVASYAYFASICVETCTARRINNFFCGLFHDLPELLTRDIISPVKRSVEGLSDIIRQYEEQELDRRIFGPLRMEGYAELAEKLEYYLGLPTGSEFHETVRHADGRVEKIANYAQLHAEYNADGFDPKDGRLIKDCDVLAAFLEAHSSIRNGVASQHLQTAEVRLRTELSEHSVGDMQWPSLLADFD